MKNSHDAPGESGLQFFGKISASLSHEMKNALAVINENAGLLTDLVYLSEKGRPLDPERIKGVGMKVMERVKNADSIIKNLNTFAHTVDNPANLIDVGDHLELLISLTRRICAGKSITVTLVRPEPPVTIEASAYSLIHLCWCCLEKVMQWAGEGKTVSLIPEKTENALRIRFTKLENLPNNPDIFTEEKEKSLLAAFGARVSSDAKAKEVILNF
ncbi:MAG: hypothetical protein AB7S75_24750 [Desulfococcaceae bacterium]